MIIYGSRMYGRRNPVKGWGYCDHCGKYGKNLSYSGRKWGHLYFIPLIPEGPHMRVIKECRSCSHGRHLPETEVPGVVNDLRTRANGALAALIEGQKQFNNEGKSVPCAPYLASSVDLFYSLGEQDYVRLMTAALKEKKCHYEYHLVSGGVHEFNGQLDDAARAYMSAAQADVINALPLLSLGGVHMKRKDYASARPVYEKALELSENKFPVHRVLLTVYEELKDHANLASTYEACFARLPELRRDKKMSKAYEKACKKAGRQPQP